MVSAGEISGYLSGDGTRFFSTEVKKSAAPALPADEEPPAFLRFNTTPGRILATLGLIIIIASYLSLTLNSSVEIQNISAGALFLGILVMCGGCYWISMRKTPP